MRIGGPRSKKIKVEEFPRYALRCGCDDASFCAVNAAEIALLTASLLLQVTTGPFISATGIAALSTYEKRASVVQKTSLRGLTKRRRQRKFCYTFFRLTLFPSEVIPPT